MKKIFLSLAVVVLGLTQVSAQSFSGGVKADANMSNFILSDFNLTESNMGFGASLGGFLKYEVAEHFAIQPELLFHYKTSTTEILNFDNDFRYFGAEIPVYALGQWSAGSGKCYIGVGPYIGLGFSAKYDNTDTDLYEKNDITDESSLRRFDFGFGAMLGYEFDNGIQINAAYKIGVIDVMDAGRDNASMLPQTINLGVGYRF